MNPYTQEDNPSTLYIAACMLDKGDRPDTSNIHPELTQYIRSVKKKCENAGGQLRSRQVIANIIVQWRAFNPKKSPYSK